VKAGTLLFKFKFYDPVILRRASRRVRGVALAPNAYHDAIFTMCATHISTARIMNCIYETSARSVSLCDEKNAPSGTKSKPTASGAGLRKEIRVYVRSDRTYRHGVVPEVASGKRQWRV
jgi:hypothetical protein